MRVCRRTGHMGMSEEARSQRGNTLGGSDARIIMSGDQEAIERLWREKRGEGPKQDFSDVLLVQMGNVMEPLIGELGKTIELSSICGLGRSVPVPLRCAVNYFEDDLNKYLNPSPKMEVVR